MLEDYLLAIEQLEQRLPWLEQRIEQLSQQPAYAEAVAALRCFRGIDTITAMGLVTELHDFMRFHSARGLMAFLGLVPSEHSSGDSERRGAITKAGNRHARRLLIEAAWHYRHRPTPPTSSTGARANRLTSSPSRTRRCSACTVASTACSRRASPGPRSSSLSLASSPASSGPLCDRRPPSEQPPALLAPLITRTLEAAVDG